MEKTKTILDGNNKAILEAIGVANLSEKDGEEVSQAVLDHISKVITETMIVNLTDKQIPEFRAALGDSRRLEDKIQELASRIPGLAAKIENAVIKELEVIKGAYQTLKK